MKRKELTKTFMMISERKYLSALRVLMLGHRVQCQPGIQPTLAVC